MTKLEQIKLETEKLRDKSKYLEEKFFKDKRDQDALYYQGKRRACEELLPLFPEALGESGLTTIPEEVFISRITNPFNGKMLCPGCSSLVETTFHPYGYDPDNNDVHYIGVCPKCGKPLYSKD